MTKTMEVYFKNENDAESAKIKLEPLKVSNMLVDKMPTDQERHFIPIAQVNFGSPGVAGVVNPLETKIGKEDEEVNKVNNDEITHLLQFDVAEEDTDKVKKILHQFDCYSSY